MYDDSRECPNKPYVSQWQRVKLLNGKPLVEENFTNDHWNTGHSESNAESTLEKNDNIDEILPNRSKTSQEKNEEPKVKQQNNTQVEGSLQPIWKYWHLYPTGRINFWSWWIKIWKLCLPIVKRKHTWSVDRVALNCMPQDFCEPCLPICTTGDGNCLPRTISQSLFGYENHHLEIRL